MIDIHLSIYFRPIDKRSRKKKRFIKRKTLWEKVREDMELLERLSHV